MMPWLEWIENSWLSTTLRDSPNVFVYPTILAFHTLGLAFVVGISSAVSLRILGVAPGVPMAPLKKFFPVMFAGLWLTVASGVLLLIIEPTKFLTMLDFYLKLLAIAVAVGCMRFLYVSAFAARATTAPGIRTSHKAAAGVLLVAWGAAITAGRLTAYDTTTAQTQTALATLVISIVMLALGYIVVRAWQLVVAPARADAQPQAAVAGKA